MKKWMILFSIICLSSCGPTPYYTELLEVNELQWTTEEKLSFSPLIEDVSSKYDLHLIIAHNQSYSYENIYFKILTIFPNGKEQEEQLSVDLADNKGQWIGKCSGDNCKCKVYLLENFKFPELGRYDFEVRQYTRNEKLEGVKSLEMQLFKKEEKG